MNIPVRHATAATKLAIVDCDIHPAFRKPSDLYPFLPTQWREHMITFGEHLRQGLSGQLAWPRMTASPRRKAPPLTPGWSCSSPTSSAISQL